MSTPELKKQTTDDTRIGIHAALQPLSGIVSVDESGAVNGLGRGGFVRKEEAKQSGKR